MNKKDKEILKIEQRIKGLMEKQKVSLGQLSDLTDIPKTTIHRYLSDGGSIPTDRLSLIAEALYSTPEYLMGWDDSQDIYGNHEENIKAFQHDPELLDFYMQMHESENLKLLFDTARELTPRELEKVLRYMKLVIEEEL